MIHNLPYKQEVYSVAARPLSDFEIEQVAREVENDARIYREDPRAWPSYAMFLGHQVSKAMHLYQLDGEAVAKLFAYLRAHGDLEGIA